MITETKNINQVTILFNSGTIQVQWVNTFYNDGVEISQSYERCSYSSFDRDKFINDVPDSGKFITLMGW